MPPTAAPDSPPSPVAAALRAARPLLVAQAVVFASGFALQAGLVLLLDPSELGALGLLRQTLQWACVFGTFGLAQGVLRLLPERPGSAGELLGTAWTGVLVCSAAVTAALVALPALRHSVMAAPLAVDGYVVYGWKAPCVALGAVAVAAVHASGRLRRKAVLEGTERVLVLLLTLGGVVAAGFQGLLWGSLTASALAAGVALAAAWPRRALPAARWPVLKTLARVGRPQVGFLLLETLRPLLALRLLQERAPSSVDTGHLFAAMGFTLPLVVLPEALAQALYRDMVGPSGEAPDLDRTHRRVLLDLLRLALPLLLLVAAVAAWALPRVRAGAYAGAVPAVLLLLPGVAAQGLVAHTGYVLLVRHRVPRAMAASAVALAVTGGLAWWLVPLYGASGAAAALSAALVVRAGLLLAATRRAQNYTGPPA